MQQNCKARSYLVTFVTHHSDSKSFFLSWNNGLISDAVSENLNVLNCLGNEDPWIMARHGEETSEVSLGETQSFERPAFISQ